MVENTHELHTHERAITHQRLPITNHITRHAPNKANPTSDSRSFGDAEPADAGDEGTSMLFPAGDS